MARRLLIVNADILTMDPANPRAGVLLVEDGRIAAVGESASVERKGRGAETLDLEGLAVVPGFIDAHAHMVATGLARTSLDLFGLPTISDILDAIRRRGAETPRGGWVVVSGFDDTMVRDRRYPTAAELDAAAPDHPVFVNRMDGHSCVLSSKAILALRVDPAWPGVDLDGGRPSGVLRGDANARAQAAFDAGVPRPKREAAFAEACRRALEVGLTAVHTIEAPGVDSDIVLAARTLTPLHLRLYVIANEIPEIPPGAEGLKLFADGSMDSHTALLFEPYADRPDTAGIFYQSPEKMRSLAHEAESRGLHVITHAIGDRAIDETLRAYEGLRPDARHRIEHFELPLDEHVSRCQERGIVVSTQPAFVHFWDYRGFYEARVGPVRARGIHPYRRIADSGALLCGGSDAPVTPLGPLLGVHAAVNHPIEGQRLRVEEALRMFTADAARAGNEEGDRGSLAPGKLGDFVVLDRDPTRTSPRELKDIRVLRVFIRGREVSGGP